jgi:hypothetical protein
MTGGASGSTFVASGGALTTSMGGAAATGGRGGAAATSGGAAATGGRGGATATSGGTTKGGSSTGGSGTNTGGTRASGGQSTSTATGGKGGTGGTPTGGTSSTGGRGGTGGTSTSGSSSGGQSRGGTSSTGGTGNLAPSSGALLGAFTPAQSEAEMQKVEAQVGRKFAIHLGYFDWSLDYTAFARADISAGRIPYVTVEPFNTSLDSIASGAEDNLIRSRATAVKSLGGKLLLRFAHEMNGNWYAWDGYHNGANTAAPQKYVAAYRHLHDVFTSAGATNVLWVFCPNVDSVPNEAWNQWSNYYPGDAYVDWMCFDGYNWGTDTFTSMTSRIYSGLAAKGKPIMLGETSTKDVEKANWIAAILPAMKSQFPLLKALVWFDVNKENDWRFDSTSSSLSAFVTMAKDPYFNPK